MYQVCKYMTAYSCVISDCIHCCDHRTEALVYTQRCIQCWVTGSVNSKTISVFFLKRERSESIHIQDLQKFHILPQVCVHNTVYSHELQVLLHAEISGPVTHLSTQNCIQQCLHSTVYRPVSQLCYNHVPSLLTQTCTTGLWQGLHRACYRGEFILAVYQSIFFKR